jgi:hypothetical protein
MSVLFNIKSPPLEMGNGLYEVIGKIEVIVSSDNLFRVHYKDESSIGQGNLVGNPVRFWMNYCKKQPKPTKSSCCSKKYADIRKSQPLYPVFKLDTLTLDKS